MKRFGGPQFYMIEAGKIGQSERIELQFYRFVDLVTQRIEIHGKLSRIIVFVMVLFARESR